tara:strand:- start:10955 stop:11947 length:993 start_codon:yes stop_codon:yes gene_type:complete
MNLHDATETLTDYLEADIPSMLWGAPGIGKSDIVKSIAKERGWPMIDFRANLRDPVDLRGLPSIKGDTSKWLPPHDLPNADRDGSEGILFLDEINTAAPSMQAACFGLVLDRKVGEYQLPPGWRIVAAGNRQSDKAAAQRMPTALANRFAHIDVEHDVETFARWAYKNTIDPMVIAFLKFRPGLLHSMEGSDVRAFPSPRQWASVSKVATAPQHRLLRLVSGLVGSGAASEFMGFLRTLKDLPSLDLVLTQPERAPVPKDRSAMFAISIALAARVETSGELENAAIYCGRMPGEFEVLMMTDAVNRDIALSHTAAYSDWAQRNKDIIFGD